MKLLVVIFLIGLVIGFAMQIEPTVTGKATCVADNQECVCDDEVCICGNMTLERDICYPNI